MRVFTLALALGLMASDCKGTPTDSDTEGTDTDTDTDTDSDTDDDSDSDSDSDTAVEAFGLIGNTTLRNANPSCTDDDRSVLGPNAGEEGELLAARFTPDGFPFNLQSLHISLVNEAAGGANCDADLPITIQVFVEEPSATGAPPTSPTAVETFHVPAPSAVSGTERHIYLHLTNPVDVVSGESVYVAVKTTGVFPAVTCVETCENGGAAQLLFWSQADSAPYSWADLYLRDTFRADPWIEVGGDI